MCRERVRESRAGSGVRAGPALDKSSASHRRRLSCLVGEGEGVEFDCRQSRRSAGVRCSPPARAVHDVVQLRGFNCGESALAWGCQRRCLHRCAYWCWLGANATFKSIYNELFFALETAVFFCFSLLLIRFFFFTQDVLLRSSITL